MAINNIVFMGMVRSFPAATLLNSPALLARKLPPPLSGPVEHDPPLQGEPLRNYGPVLKLTSSKARLLQVPLFTSPLITTLSAPCRGSRCTTTTLCWLRLTSWRMG